MTRQRLKLSMFTNKPHDARCFRNNPVSKGLCEIWQCWHSWNAELLWSPEIKTLLSAVGISASKAATLQKLWGDWLRRILKKYLSRKVQYALLRYWRVINLVLSNPFRNFRAKGSLKFLVDKRKFKKTNELPLSNYPILTDFTDSAGVMSGHYFHQDLVVAQKIFEAQPRRHVNVGSRIDGFVTHVATFRPIEIIDIRVI